MGLPYAALGGDFVFGFVVGIYGGRDVVVVAAAEDVAAVFQFYHAHGGLHVFFLHVIYFFEVIEVIEVNDDSWYTINGVKLNGKPSKSGLYINKGMKVVIK